MNNIKPLLYQVRINVKDEAAKKIREKSPTYLYSKITSILSKIDGKLICQFDAFNNFVKECEMEGETNNPLYKWTKDTIQNEAKKKKYLKSFTIYINKEQLYDKQTADYIEAKLKDLRDENILQISKYNSDPKNNPQPPKKYF